MEHNGKVEYFLQRVSGVKIQEVLDVLVHKSLKINMSVHQAIKRVCLKNNGVFFHLYRVSVSLHLEYKVEFNLLTNKSTCNPWRAVAMNHLIKFRNRGFVF